MILTEEKRNELLEAAKPLMKFLAENFHPHAAILLNSNSAELLEGVCTVGTDEFLKD